MARVSLRSFARSSGYAAIASLWRVGAGIFLTPLILARIGLDGYGIWTLLHSLSLPIGLVGGSFGLAYTKYTAEADARGEHDRLRELLGSGVALVLTIAIAAVSILWLARDPILSLAGVPAPLLEDAGVALVLVALTVLARQSAGCVRPVLAGLQRTDLQFKSVILSSMLYFVLAIGSLSVGWGLPGLGASYLVAELVAIAVAWRWCRQLYPRFRMSPLDATRAGIREVAALGGRFQLLQIVDLLNQCFRWLLSGLLGPAALGVYEIAHKLIRLSETGTNAILAPMMPAFASLHAGSDPERVRSAYSQGARLLISVSLVSFSFTAIFADRAILLWTGADYPLAAWTLRTLMAAFVIKQLSGVGTASLRSRGRVRLELLSGGLTIALRALLLVPLFWLWAYEGFVVAASAAGVLASLWFAWAFCRQEGIALSAFLGGSLLRPIVALGPAIAIFALTSSRLALAVPGWSARWSALADLSLWGVAWVLALAPALWFAVLKPAERTSLLEAFSTPLTGDRAS